MFTKDLFDKIDALGTVRSVQRGTYSAVKTSTITIPLNEINTEKVKITLNGYATYHYENSGSTWAYAYGYSYLPYVVSISNNSLVINVNGSSSSLAQGSWEVIEFY